MAEEGTSFRAVLILIIAAILILATFSFLTVVYPTGPASGKQEGGQFQLFQASSNDTNGLGQNNTAFNPTSKMLVLVEGYVSNISSGRELNNSKLIVAVYPEETVTITGISGYYQYYVRYTGSGSFAYKVPGYDTAIVKITVVSPAVWKNVSLHPSTRYLVSGKVIDTYGNGIADYGIKFTNYYQTIHTKSNLTGYYAIRLYNENYYVTTSGWEYLTTNTTLTVQGLPVPNFDINLTPNVTHPISISGYASNRAGVAVSGARVSVFPIINSTLTNPAGYFSIADLYGSVSLTANASGYNNTNPSVNLSKTNLPPGGNWSVKITFNPVSTIGDNLTVLWLSNNSQTGDPTVNFTTLHSSLSPYSISGSRKPGLANLNVTLFSGSTVLNNTSLIVYVDSNGILYRGIFSTDSAGQFNLLLNYTGYYGLAVLTLYGGMNTTAGNFSGLGYVDLGFPLLRQHNMSIQATNVFNGIPVPGQGLTFSNSLLPVPGYFIQVSNSTYFNFTLPNGEYLMSYNNPGFANSSFSVNLTGNNTFVTVDLLPYTVEIVNGANLTWNVTISATGYMTNYTLPIGGNSSSHVFEGSFVIQAVAINGSYVAKGYVNTSSSIPVRIAYLNQTYGNESVNANSSNCNFDNVTGIATGTFPFNLTFSSQIMLMGISLLSLNFTPLNSTISAGNINFTFNGSYLNFTNPIVLAGGMISVSFTSSGLTVTQGNELCKLLTIRIDYSYVVVTVAGLG